MITLTTVLECTGTSAGERALHWSFTSRSLRVHLLLQDCCCALCDFVNEVIEPEVDVAIDKAPRGPRSRARIVRWIVLATVLTAITVIGYLHQVLAVNKPQGVDALCPFGGLETLASFITSGVLIRKIAMSSLVLLGAVLGTAVVFRRSFCGQLCPLGALQEGFGAIGRKLMRGKRLTMPKSLDRVARLFKYGVLLGFLSITWATSTLVMRSYDPWVAYMHLTTAEVAEYAFGFGVLAVSMAGSMLYDRFFCKYACPMGAFLGLISRFSLFKIRRNAETCIDCTLCDKACPVNIEVSSADVINSAECINCNECVTACPVKDTLEISTASGTRLSPLAMTGSVVAIFTAAILLGSITGDFSITKPTLAQESGSAAGQGSGNGGGEGSFVDTGLIRGSTRWNEITEATGIPAETITDIFGIPADDQSRALKDSTELYGVSPGEARAWVDLWQTDRTAAENYVPGTLLSEDHEE